VAEDVLGAAKDGGVKALIVARVIFLARASAGGGTHVLSVGSDIVWDRARVRVAARRSIPFSPERLRSPRPLRARPSRVDRHCHWACRTKRGFQTFKGRLARR